MTKLKIEMLKGVLTSEGHKETGELVKLPEVEALSYVNSNRARIADGDPWTEEEATEYQNSQDEQKSKKSKKGE